MYTYPDNYDAYDAYERQERKEEKEYLESLPVCGWCGKAIEDHYYDLSSDVVCEDCINDTIVFVG